MKKAYVVLGVLVFAFAVAYVGIQAKANGQLEAQYSLTLKTKSCRKGSPLIRLAICTSALVLPYLPEVVTEQFGNSAPMEQRRQVLLSILTDRLPRGLLSMHPATCILPSPTPALVMEAFTVWLKTVV